VPVVPSCLLEPLWDQVAALLPRHRTSHPDHRWAATVAASPTGPSSSTSSRPWSPAPATDASPAPAAPIAPSVVASGMGAAGDRPARARPDPAAYDRMLGLGLGELSVDGCITKAPAAATRRAGPRRTAASRASNDRSPPTPAGSRLGSSPRRQPPRWAAAGSHPGGRDAAGWRLPADASVHLDRGYDSAVTRRLLDELGLPPPSPARASPPRSRPAGGGWCSARTRG
jgi:hypothetical protein